MYHAQVFCLWVQLLLDLDFMPTRSSYIRQWVCVCFCEVSSIIHAFHHFRETILSSIIVCSETKTSAFINCCLPQYWRQNIQASLPNLLSDALSCEVTPVVDVKQLETRQKTLLINARTREYQLHVHLKILPKMTILLTNTHPPKKNHCFLTWFKKTYRLRTKYEYNHMHRFRKYMHRKKKTTTKV